MKTEKPILMSTPMVQAILAGRKTQTRRIIKDVDALTTTIDRYNETGNWTMWYDRKVIRQLRSKYNIGDVLWVRETWQTWALGWVFKATYGDKLSGGVKWKPSIFMPKEACRIKLLIKDIRVERLQDISEQDAVFEGIEEAGEFWKSYEIIHSGRHKGEMNPHSTVPNLCATTSYHELWESINGFKSWEKNPFVWVIEFKKL